MMSWTTAIVLIVLISVIGSTLRSRRHGNRSLRRDREDGQQLPSAREKQLEREVEDLRERIHVLERIATDGNSIDAKETRRISEEIEALRDENRS